MPSRSLVSWPLPTRSLSIALLAAAVLAHPATAATDTSTTGVAAETTRIPDTAPATPSPAGEPAGGRAGNAGTSARQRATALLDRAVTRMQQDRAQALLDFSQNPAFVDGELYVFVLGQHGRMLASGGSSAPLVGRNMTHQTDARGRFFFRELLDNAAREPSGSVDYWWLNRKTNRVEHKTSFYRTVNGDIVCVGYYNDR